ncbi:MAG: extracellular solute-binding protein [Phycisphaerales bacterium]
MTPTLARTAVVLGAISALSACDAPDPNTPIAQTVVLYTSADDVFVRSVVDAFEQETGIRVDLVGDTEATKTTGLVTRLLAEKEAPRCDVWWSSEPMGTLLLAEAGVLEPGAMTGSVPSDWPAELIGADDTWIGFAERARVIAFSADRVENPPTTLAALTTPDWSGRVGMARPQFGTTRGHMALLADRWGIPAFRAWLEAMQDNGLKLYDGNARVVRAIHEGEIDLALTDTDDVWVAIANTWPIGMTYETRSDHFVWPSIGPTTIPNTVGVVAGGPNPDAARVLATFLVSPTVEQLLAASQSRNIPVHADLRVEFSELIPPNVGNGRIARPDYSSASIIVSGAIDMCERVLMSP